MPQTAEDIMGTISGMLTKANENTERSIARSTDLLTQAVSRSNPNMSAPQAPPPPVLKLDVPLDDDLVQACKSGYPVEAATIIQIARTANWIKMTLQGAMKPPTPPPAAPAPTINPVPSA
jgi:hypothetical protein